MGSDSIQRQEKRSVATDRPTANDKAGFKAMGFVDAVVGTIVEEVFSKVDMDTVRNALKGGSLKCLHDTWRGGHIEITTIDLDSLMTPGSASPEIQTRMEDSMKSSTAIAIDSLGEDKVETLLQAAQSAALGEDEYLSVHEVEDYLCFAVIRPTADISPVLYSTRSTT